MKNPESRLVGALYVVMCILISASTLALCGRTTDESATQNTFGNGVPATPGARATPSWSEKDGVIEISPVVTSAGATSERWGTYLETLGRCADSKALHVLASTDFKPATGVHKIVVLKGSLFEDGARTRRGILAEASKRNWVTPSAEIACFIRAMFTDAQIHAMGFGAIVTMHELIRVDHSAFSLLVVNTLDGGGLHTFGVDPNSGEPYDGLSNGLGVWSPNIGFAFVVPQGPPQP